jgi:hypothetical protein
MKILSKNIAIIWAQLKPSSKDVRIFLIILVIVVFGLRYMSLVIYLQFYLVLFVPPLIWLAYRFPKPLAMLAISIVIEQSLLYGITEHLKYRINRDDKILFRYINTLPKPLVGDFYKGFCQWYQYALIYHYQMCTYRIGLREVKKYSIRLQYPPAYITFLSPYYGDRIIMYGTHLAIIDGNHNITSDLRVKK